MKKRQKSQKPTQNQTRSQTERPQLSIVIPALREEKRIGKTLDELADYLKTEPLLKALAVEVLVVSADSPDRTHEIVLEKAGKFADLRLLKPGPKVGKGRDVQHGMLRANGKVIMFMDADLATPLHHIPRFYKVHQEGADVVVATRNIWKHHKTFGRTMVSVGGNMLFRLAGGVRVEDSQCGFKMFSQEAAKVCFSKLKIMQWTFDMEVLAIAKANRYRLKALRVNDWQDVGDSKFESRPGHIRENLWELAHIFYRRLNGYYRTSGNELDELEDAA